MANLLPALPFRQYIQLDGISTTQLKAMDPTPRHYWDKYINPDRERAETTPEMIVSNAARLLVHSPDSWPDEYATIPEGLDRRTKEGKELFAKVAAQGLTPIKKDEADRAQAIAEAVCELGAARSLFADREGLHDAVITWEDAETGYLCKVRLDWHLPPCEAFPTGVIWSTKTSTDIGKEGFRNQAYNAAYHISAAMQITAFMAQYGTQEPPIYIWGAARSRRPFIARPFYATGQQIELGLSEYQRLIRSYADCTAADEWPGYPDELTDCGLPPFAKKPEITP